MYAGNPKCSFINKKYEHLLYDVGVGNHFYSFYDLVLHEFAHILGFLHPTDCGKKDEENSIMHPISNANVPSEGLTDYDKCMFAKLYCSDLVVGIEENVVRPEIIISPNPASKELNISFEILGGTKAVSIQLLNEQGQLLETLLTSAIYNSGIHIYSASLDLPSGIYFVLTKINHTIYSEKIIIK